MSTNDHEEDDEKITLSEAQLKVIDRIMKRKSTFFTGAAGTGKSYIVAIVIKILKHLELMNKIALTAPTGVAACNISGMTIHSWAGVGLGTDDVQTLYNKLRGRGSVNEDVMKRWKETEILVIDEVSMLSAELFEKISTLGSLVRKDKRPFGGLQVILCGDFFQLPPVNRGESFCFQSPVWEELLGSDGKIVLDKVFRQKDGPFVRILNDMRRGLVSPECNAILTQKMHETTRLLSAQQVASSAIGHESIKHTCLFSRNEDCDRLNDFELRKLPPFKQPISLNNPYNAPLEEDRGLVFEAIEEPSNKVHLLKHCKAPKTLELRIGAQVMLLKNLDQDVGLVNGSRGIIVDFKKDPDDVSAFRSNEELLPEVKFSVTRGGVESEVTQIIGYANFEVKRGDVVEASRRQIPLMLAWAVSIHKSQGLTIPFLQVSFESIFEFGQAYVALSRATDLTGLRIRSFHSKAIKAHPQVKEFYESLGCDLERPEQLNSELHTTTVSTLSNKFVRELPPGQPYDSEEWIENQPSASKRKAASETGNTGRDVRTKVEGGSKTNPTKRQATEKENTARIDTKTPPGGMLNDYFERLDKRQQERDHLARQGAGGRVTQGRSEIKPPLQTAGMTMRPQESGGSLAGLSSRALKQPSAPEPALGQPTRVTPSLTFEASSVAAEPAIVLTADQREQIERNKRIAVERRAAKAKRDQELLGNSAAPSQMQSSMFVHEAGSQESTELRKLFARLV